MRDRCNRSCANRLWKRGRRWLADSVVASTVVKREFAVRDCARIVPIGHGHAIGQPAALRIRSSVPVGFAFRIGRRTRSR